MRVSESRVQGAEVCSGFEAGSYLRLIDFLYHSTLGLRVIKKKKTEQGGHLHGVAVGGERPRFALLYRGTSLIRNSAPLGPYSSPMPRDLW